ncbi:MAG: amylo-alpha-1,6-glucosidase [Rubricoccaceae bacterium]|nr:amylo-alpha-1,6-glucosidase [Rubricoccaceae bacterium]
MTRPHVLVLLVLGLVAGCSGCIEEADKRIAAEGPEALADLAVFAEAPAEDDTLDARRAFFFSDGAGTFLYDALVAPQDDAAMGFVAGGYRMLDGWRWWSEDDSTLIGPEDRVRGLARPDFAVRAYVEEDTSGFVARLFNKVRGIEEPSLTEQVALLDGRGALLVEIPDSSGVLGFRPVVSDRSGASDYQVEARDGTLLIARGNYLAPRGDDPRPVWLAVRATGGTARTAAAEETPEGGRRIALTLGEVAFPTPGRVVVATADTPEAADSLAALALRDAEALMERRSARMAALLDRTPFATGDESFDHAFQWARLTLDALMAVDSSGTYVLPGVPGAEPPPGRSGLDVLGALLATGDWEAARGLLTPYGRAQRFDERIDVLGRAPTLVRPGGRAEFATADATPLYLAAAGDYVRATGDRSLVQGEPNFWFKSVFAMRGLYGESRRHGPQVSPEGFLLAGDGETWMQSPANREGVATPRGGVPIEGQGALYRALRTLTDFATIMGVAGRETAAWYADSADVLLRRVPQRYVSGDRVVDGYDRRGAPSDVTRPNALLALARLDLPAEQKARLTRALAERLAYPHGVATRPQTDSLFHPFAEAAEYYSADDARFNGPVWTWLSGPLIELMAQTGAADRAYELLANEAALIVERGVVGAIPDMLDAHPRTEDAPPAVAGAPVQPWSLGQFLANAYRDLAGIRYATPTTVVLAPHLPDAWGETATRVRLGDGWVNLAMEQSERELSVQLSPEGALPEGAVVQVRAFGLEAAVPVAVMQGDTLAVAAPPVAVAITPDGVEVDGERVAADRRYERPDPAWWEGFAWAQPRRQERYAVMRRAEAQTRLVDNDILRENPTAVPILTQVDPDGDDWGATNTYTYPTAFPDGVLDATYLEVTEDDSTTYFRAEFVNLAAAEGTGLQPTFAALAIDTEPGGKRTVERNARYDFPQGEGYEYVIFVGDGLVVEDASGRVLGEVAPGEGTAFNPPAGALSFALPRFVLPDVPRGASVTLLVGAHDPGRGVGRFASVEAEAGEMRGGGKVDDRAPNVFDFVTATVVR